jgi:hypothetical protein
LGEPNETFPWIIPFSNWLASIGNYVYEAEPFPSAVTGWLTLLDVDDVLQIEKSKIPEKHSSGYLKEEKRALNWYPPNILTAWN